MTFRISKYTFNSWKTAAADKNKMLVEKEDWSFSIYSGFLFTVIFLNLTLGVSFYKQLVKENRLVHKKVNN
jgi:hypothetical protein